MGKLKGDPEFTKKVVVGLAAVVVIVLLVFVLRSTGGGDDGDAAASNVWAPGRFTFKVDPGRFVAGEQAKSWTEARWES